MPYYDSATIGESGLVKCGGWIVSAGTQYGPYVQDVHEVFWIIDGGGVIESEGVSIELRPHAVYHIELGVEHVIRWDPRRSTRFGWAKFTTEPGDPEIPRVRFLSADDIVIALLNHVLWLMTARSAGWDSAAAQAFDYALRAFRTGMSSTRSGVDGVYSELVTRTLAAMQRHWRGPVEMPTLRHLASELGVTPQHLCRVFERELHLGPISVFRIVRVVWAARMLTETNRSIREISTALGFANPFHFSRVFKSVTGIPPGEYRAHPTESASVPPQIEALLGYFPEPSR